MREKTCCFTGHRNVPYADEEAVVKRMDMLIRALHRKGVTDFCVGGAIGFDTIAAQHLLFLRDVRHIKLRVILICPFDGFTSRWKPEQQKVFERLERGADEIIYKETRGSRGAYFSRNRELVDRSAYCIAYCTRAFGGTAYTVRYAMKNGVAVLNTVSYDVFML